MEQLKLDLPLHPGPLWDQEEIRGLSFWQPFGTLMLYGKVETREWDTKYRGLVLICTTATPYWKQPVKKRAKIIFSEQNRLDVDSWGFVESGHTHSTRNLDGYAIAIGKLSDSRPAKPEDNTFIVITEGLFSHTYTDVKRIKPFQVKGGQGWFKVTPEMRSQIKLL